MMPPALAARRFLMALWVGAKLGIFYGFLRPMGLRHRHLADVIFVPVALWAWIVLTFGICQADPRLSYTVGMMLGTLAWELTLGRLLRSVWLAVWRWMGRFFAILFLPVKFLWKNSTKICKKVLASGKKWFTMVWISCRDKRRRSGGTADGKKRKNHRADPLQKGKSAGEGCDTDRGGAVHRHAGDPARKHRKRPQSV